MNEIEAVTHQYLLHAVWKVKDHHGQEVYGHRVIHSTAEGPWDPKAYIDRFVRSEHPGWLPEGLGNIGFVQENAELSRVTVFKVHEWTDDAWGEWLEENKAKRAEISRERERAADLLTIKMLQEKWGLNEQAASEEGEGPAETGEAAEEQA